MENRCVDIAPNRIQLELDQMYRSMGASRHVSRVWETPHANGLTSRSGDGNITAGAGTFDRGDVFCLFLMVLNQWLNC
uniref:Uncharacterized protein n=1 Tax=Acrobeloides nanus TaxID=290746 RepID=A0A914DJR2_9BILA